MTRRTRRAVAAVAIVAALAGSATLGRVSASERSDTGPDCPALSWELVETADYHGDMAPCLGEEDSPAVAALLYGRTDALAESDPA